VTTGSRILVTGAGGFLGGAVVRELAAGGAHVRALVRRPEAARDFLPRIGRGAVPVDVVVASLGENHVEEDVVAGCDVIVHAAGALRGAASTLVRQNAVATRRLVCAAAQQAVRRFVLVSSLGVYDPARLRPGDVLDESCPLDPQSETRTAYVYSKIAQEQVCWDAYRAQHLPLVVVRPGVIFGPGRSCPTDRVGPRVGRWVAVIGPLRPLPYTFVQNCARAVALAATALPEISGECFNIVDDELPTAREIVRRCRGAGATLRSVPVPARCAPLLSRMFACVYRWSDGMLPAAFAPRLVDAMYKPLEFSNERAKRRLGWNPSIDLETAFDLTFGVAR
jgi:nucleoside-diphosphate-sugar epimerase